MDKKMREQSLFKDINLGKTPILALNSRMPSTFIFFQERILKGIVILAGVKNFGTS